VQRGLHQRHYDGGGEHHGQDHDHHAQDHHHDGHGGGQEDDGQAQDHCGGHHLHQVNITTCMAAKIRTTIMAKIRTSSSSYKIMTAKIRTSMLLIMTISRVMDTMVMKMSFAGQRLRSGRI
jgi:ABC-type Zn2+ transport system substrate-binding protein/surface adhesin